MEMEEGEEVSGSSHSSLADTLLEDFAGLPGKKEADVDEFAVINVGPSVVPNPYVPTFRVFVYNTTGEAYEQSRQQHDEEEEEEEEVGARGRDHSHTHPDREKEKAECKKKKEEEERWACRARKPVHASGKSPSRTNRLWTPLGFAQVSGKLPEARTPPDVRARYDTDDFSFSLTFFFLPLARFWSNGTERLVLAAGIGERGGGGAATV